MILTPLELIQRSWIVIRSRPSVVFVITTERKREVGEICGEVYGMQDEVRAIIAGVRSDNGCRAWLVRLGGVTVGAARSRPR